MGGIRVEKKIIHYLQVMVVQLENIKVLQIIRNLFIYQGYWKKNRLYILILVINKWKINVKRSLEKCKLKSSKKQLNPHQNG